MEDLKQQIALVALNEMMAGNHLSICTIDSVAEMLGVKPDKEARATLAPLHCINWSKLPPEVRDAVPGLIQKCLGVAPVFKFRTLEPVVIEVRTAQKKQSMIQRLGLS
jgi:hypothetical protein